MYVIPRNEKRLKSWTIASIISCMAFLSCNRKEAEVPLQFTKIGFHHSVPLVKPDGELINISDSFYIYASHQLRIYQLPYTYFLPADSLLLHSEIRYRYFVFRKNETFGMLYMPDESTTGSRRAVDSLLKEAAFSGQDWYDPTSDSLLYSTPFPSPYTTKQTYISKAGPDFSFPDTSYFYFSDFLRSLDCSLSPRLDSLYHTKVSKVVLAYNEQYYKGIPIKIPARQFKFELKLLPFKEKDCIEKLLNQFERDNPEPKK